MTKGPETTIPDSNHQDRSKFLKMSKKSAAFILTVTCVGLTLYCTVFYVPSSIRPPSVKVDPTRKELEREKNRPRTILWYFPPRYLPKDINGRVRLSACPQLNCVMTRNKTFLSESDAVIFSAEHIQGDLPFRKPGQVWIFHNNEPPFLFAYGRPFHKPPWSSAFNWTMDFRHDADIVRPYAVLRTREKPVNKNYTSIVSRKTGKVAIMVSNCINWSGRLNYVKELNKHIPVDIFGKCGKNMFPREKNHDWLKYLNLNYMFYLGFENLYCKDYISEKFFNNFNLDLVTVTRGGGNYSRDAPPGTFINVADFKTPHELANHLWFLINNTDKYIDILKKKDEYFYETDEYFYIDATGSPFYEHYYEKQPLCELCKRLLNIEQHFKTIPNIVPWFQKGICKKTDFTGTTK